MAWVKAGGVLLLGLALSLKAHACLNAPGTTLDGDHRGTFYPQIYHVLNRSREDTPESRAKKLREGKLADGALPEEINAVAQVFLGQYDEAIEVIRVIWIIGSLSKYPINSLSRRNSNLKARVTLGIRWQPG